MTTAVTRKLSAEEQRFCGEYVVDFAPTKAAQRAGLSRPGRASSLLKDPAIQQEVQRISHGLLRRADLSAEATVKEIGNLAFSNLDDFIVRNADGSATYDFRKVTRDQMAAVRSLTVVEEVEEDGTRVRATKLELWDKRGALADLGRHFGIFKQPENAFAVAIVLSPDELNA